MSDFSLSDTLRSLASKLDSVQEVLGGSGSSAWPPYSSLNTTMPVTPSLHSNQAVLQKLDALSQQVSELRSSVAALQQNQQNVAHCILPLNPMHGIEVVPKREVVVPEMNPLSAADRLLLNRDAKKALEAEEMGATRVDEYPLGEDEAEAEAEAEEEAEAEAEAEEEAEAEAEAEEQQAEGEAEAEELEEFEYKGNTYYRDSENNVFSTGEDGELIEKPLGLWDAEKKRIVVKKS